MQMEREMKELKRQRDHAQSQLEEERIARKEQKVVLVTTFASILQFPFCF